MRTTLRIPTKEQFAFVEIEIDAPDSFTTEQVKAVYDDYTAVFTGKGGEGLPDQEWRDVIDHYLSGKPFVGDTIMEQIGRMSEKQSFCMNEIKKSKARNK